MLSRIRIRMKNNIKIGLAIYYFPKISLSKSTYRKKILVIWCLSITLVMQKTRTLNTDYVMGELQIGPRSFTKSRISCKNGFNALRL